MRALHLRIGPDHVAENARTTYSRWVALTACKRTVPAKDVTMQLANVSCSRCKEALAK